MSEKWKAIIGYEGLYEISNLGRVKSVARTVTRRSKNGSPSTYTVTEKLRKIRANEYCSVDLSKKGIITTHKIHRLVLSAFAGPCPMGTEACHRNGDPYDNRWPENLRWATHKENEADKKKYGTYQYGEDNPHAKLSQAGVIAIRTSKESIKFLAEKFNISKSNVYCVRSGRTWQHGLEKGKK